MPPPLHECGSLTKQTVSTRPLVGTPVLLKSSLDRARFVLVQADNAALDSRNHEQCQPKAARNGLNSDMVAACGKVGVLQKSANPIKLKRVWGPHVTLSQGSSPTEDLAGGSAQDPGDEDTDLLALKNRRRSEALRDNTAVDSETASHLLGGRRPFQFSPKAAFGIRRCGAAPSTHNSGQISRSHSKLDLQQGERVQ